MWSPTERKSLGKIGRGSAGSEGRCPAADSWTRVGLIIIITCVVVLVSEFTAAPSAAKRPNHHMSMNIPRQNEIGTEDGIRNPSTKIVVDHWLNYSYNSQTHR
jgi:hypothetical protein